MPEKRPEHDALGTVMVPSDRYWGAQTQRSAENFPIGVGLETMPREIIHAFAVLGNPHPGKKRAAAGGISRFCGLTKRAFWHTV